MNVISPEQLRAQQFTAVRKTPAFYRRVAKEIGFDAGGAAKELRVAENKIRSLRDQENSHTPDSAYQAFLAHQTKAATAVDSEDFDKMEHWTLNDFVEDYAQRRQAISAAVRKICCEAYLVARKVTLKFCDQVESYAKDVREAAEKEHKRFNVEYSPSNLITALTETGPFLRRTVDGDAAPAYSETPPSQICPFLEL